MIKLIENRNNFELVINNYLINILTQDFKKIFLLYKYRFFSKIFIAGPNF